MQIHLRHQPFLKEKVVQRDHLGEHAAVFIVHEPEGCDKCAVNHGLFGNFLRQNFLPAHDCPVILSAYDKFITVKFDFDFDEVKEWN